MATRGGDGSSGSSATKAEDSDRESVSSDDDAWDDWAVGSGADEDSESSETVKCLFCEETRGSARAIYEHCTEQHSFDFLQLRRDHHFDFYDRVRLINYIRSEVAANGCERALGAILRHFESTRHSSAADGGSESGSRRVGGGLWDDEKYLAPFMPNDALLFSFDDGEGDEVDGDINVIPEESEVDDGRARAVVEGLEPAERDSLLATADGKTDPPFPNPPEIAAHASALLAEEMSTEGAPDLEDEDGEPEVQLEVIDGLQKKAVFGEDGFRRKSCLSSQSFPKKKSKGKVTFATVLDKEKLSINRSYFGSYSGFGIHREMLADKVRTEAYQAAIVKNPSLIKDSVVMDVGCGTGILSLFAAKAGARKVIAVDGSEKMTAVATQIAKANGFLDESAVQEEQDSRGRVICVVAGVIEELDSTMPVPENSADVLVSEWMGYCLLFESMLGSVLHARDKWLKPGGAMLPDTARMYLAGFGKGGTSLSFWENVYGFDMQCVGEEVVHDATQHPIIDVIPGKDVITDTCFLKEFDLTSMKHEDVDYTADFRVKLLPSAVGDMNESKSDPTVLHERSGIVKCYGLVVWFDTGFTSRFCKEEPVLLTTSPHSPKTHWSQTLLTFKEPISLCTEEECVIDPQKMDRSKVGSDDFPAFFISGRISIARSFRFRSIDISLEVTATGADGALKSWPVQMFDI